MKYEYHGFVLRAIDPALLPFAVALPEPGDMRPAAGSQGDLMILPEAARSRVRVRGHAMPPGSGPDGETCGSCASLRRKQVSKTYIKCGLTQSKWTGGSATDVKVKDPACSKWQRRFGNGLG